MAKPKKITNQVIDHKEILMVVDVVSNEKNVEKEVIFAALEEALASAVRRTHKLNIDAKVKINREDGSYKTYRAWMAVDENAEDFEQKDFIGTKHITLSAAIELEPDIIEGGFITEEIEQTAFGRISIQSAKQVIFQKVKDAVRNKIIEAYQGKVGELIMGNIKRVDRNGAYIELEENIEALIPKADIIPRESIRKGDRVRAILSDINIERKGPVLLASRTSSDFIMRLFELEVPEIGQGIIKLHTAARDPGMRAKIAVQALDPRLDAVGACVGMRGSRVQTISDELNGERVDIVLWDNDIVQFIINAMSPAEISSVSMDEDNKSMDVLVSKDNLSQAIGRSGQNVRLASELTGWSLNVVDESQSDKDQSEEQKNVIKLFVKYLDIDEDFATILAQEGFQSIEQLAYTDVEQLINIDVLDDQIAQTLQDRAMEYLLSNQDEDNEEDETQNNSDNQSSDQDTKKTEHKNDKINIPDDENKGA
ncbi:MAG: transcription termination/antitermination protein NusA [Gammaproteobacteria bacterium]|nr:MAG: transcription termination/antitermination protein NusA [Gammaproteobacteria bacterium]